MEILSDDIMGLGEMTVQEYCLREYSHYPQPQPLTQLTPMLSELGMASVKLSYPVWTVAYSSLSWIQVDKVINDKDV